MLSLLLMWIGLLGIVVNRSSIIRMLISIEILLVGLLLLSNILSVILDDILGVVLGLVILGVAGGESAVGLGMVISYNRGAILRRRITG